MHAERTKRQPKSTYSGRNGFRQGPSEHGKGCSSSLSKELETHRRAISILELRKRRVPSFDKMKEEVGRAEDLSYIKERVQKLRSEHTSDLERLYDVHAQDYLTEVTDRYRSKCELDPVVAATVQEIDGSTKEAKLQLDWANDYEALRYSYLSTLLPLKKQQIELEVKEELERRQQKQMFPQSKEQFESKPNDVKIRVARFLLADPIRREKMLNDYQWAWRQVMPLVDIFTKDEAFSAEVRGLIIMADNQIARDPRKRLSGA